MKSKLNRLFFLILLLQMSVIMASTLTEQRKAFLITEKLVEKDSRLFLNQLKKIKEYPLYPYLYYQWLKKNLAQTAKIKAFLKNSKETRYAGLLKDKWLLYLAEHKNWREFISQYKSTNNTVMQCHYYRAKYNTGAKKIALLGAKKLWQVGKSQPSECDPIFNALRTSSYFTQEIVWQRFQSALNNHQVKLALYVKRFLNKKDQAIATLWLKIHTTPSLINKKGLLINKKSIKTGLIFVHAVERLAKTNLDKAVHIWDTQKNQFKINSSEVHRIERKLALWLALNRNKSAYQRLNDLTHPDEVGREWQVRVALRTENWLQVKQSIAQLNKKTQEKEKWKYWQARALDKIGQSTEAEALFSRLSAERSFYGYLSADRLNKDYSLSNYPLEFTPSMINKFKQKTDFQVISELITVNKPLEARRQWWYAVRKLDKNNLIIAAKYAQQLHWKDVAIFTLARAKYWDDVTLRFPLDYQSQVHSNAKLRNLDSAIIFALIRRESAFNQDARSPVGARGLMQIMPKTGQQIAKELNEKWHGNQQLSDPSTNIQYGSYYYKQLLNQFNHYALAAAAYNAGPHRVNRWLPENKSLPADIWVETIPFKETRSYVSAVLTYALIYQKQLKKQSLSMKKFMPSVQPK